MSKLNDAIRVTQKERVATTLLMPVLRVETEVVHPGAPGGALHPDAYRYTIQATIGSSVECPASALEIAESTVRQQVANAVFGEFREPLLEARLAAAVAGSTKAVYAIDSVLSRMFDVE
jgi:hypothetical protein